jgi:hypothetical protein
LNRTDAAVDANGIPGCGTGGIGLCLYVIDSVESFTRPRPSAAPSVFVMEPLIEGSAAPGNAGRNFQL